MRNRGFTLIEVMAALVVGAVVMTLLYRLLTVIGTGLASARRTSASLETDANTRRWLKRAFGSVEVGQPGDSPFEGSAMRLSCTTWLEVPGGWLERGQLSLALRGDSLEARYPAGNLLIATNVIAIELAYLGSTSRATWEAAWDSPVAPPLAVRLILIRAEASDTLTYLIGGRG
jgi:prepilin-type N-terminal cleavage/methylation domain-containing protein